MTQTAHLQISGRVQGVGFRAAARERARALALVGWVANRRDGSVEILAHGTRDRLDQFRSWLGNGPPGARVDAVTELAEIGAPDTRNFIAR